MAITLDPRDAGLFGATLDSARRAQDQQLNQQGWQRELERAQRLMHATPAAQAPIPDSHSTSEAVSRDISGMPVGKQAPASVSGSADLPAQRALSERSPIAEPYGPANEMTGRSTASLIGAADATDALPLQQVRKDVRNAYEATVRRTGYASSSGEGFADNHMHLQVQDGRLSIWLRSQTLRDDDLAEIVASAKRGCEKLGIAFDAVWLNGRKLQPLV